jgi:hypothetical protein
MPRAATFARAPAAYGTGTSRDGATSDDGSSSLVGVEQHATLTPNKHTLQNYNNRVAIVAERQENATITLLPVYAPSDTSSNSVGSTAWKHFAKTGTFPPLDTNTNTTNNNNTSSSTNTNTNTKTKTNADAKWGQPLYVPGVLNEMASAVANWPSRHWWQATLPEHFGSWWHGTRKS